MVLHIGRLRVINYRNFLDLEISHFPTSAVLVGENESGKSNLIRALRLVLDPDMSLSERDLESRDMCFYNADGIKSGAHILVSVDLLGFEEDIALQAILGDFCIAGDPYRARLTYEWQPAMEEQIIPLGSGGTSSAPETSGESQSAVINEADYGWSLYGADDPARTFNPTELQRVAIQLVGALRDAERELLSSRRTNPLRQLLSALEPDPERLAETSAMLNDASAHLLADPSVGDAEKAIAAELKRLTGAALNLDPTLGLVSTEPERLLRQAKLFLDRGRTRGVADVSLGVANIVFLSLLFRAIESRRVRRSRAAVMLAIEEPEAHLHVQIQRRIFKKLIEEEEGVLVTTHSPHLASVTPLNRIILLRRDGQRGSLAFTATGAGLSLSETSDIERYLTVTRAEMLFARQVMLVEGDAELYVLPALAAAFGFDLNEYGVSVVSVQGVDFGPYWRILGESAFNIPTVVVTDGDSDVSAGEVTKVGNLRALDFVKTDVTSRIAAFLEGLPDGERLSLEDTDRLSWKLWKEAVFVGDYTLEIDLFRLLPAVALDAARPFMSPRQLQNMESDLQLLEEGDESEADRARILNRIEKIGKGRFAQRWAAYLSEPDVVDHLREEYAESDSGWEYFHAGYLLAALDQVSLRATGKPLVDIAGALPG